MSLARLGVLLLLPGLTACAAPVAEIAPGERPALDTDEAGLWLEMDRLEAQVATSGAVVRDPGLNAYVREVVCRVAGAYCRDIRIYIVRRPHFNASMAPNGMMQVWTGLLLRVHNEAELAYVLGHEVGHYVRRHSLQAWRDARSKAALVSILAVGAGAAGAAVGVAGMGAAAGLTGQVAALGSLRAFSRENEREADRLGLEAMMGAGYDPGQAARLLERLVEEQEAAKESGPSLFLATHPPTVERVDALREQAGRAAGAGVELTVGAGPYLGRLLPIRGVLLDDELRRRQFAGTDVLLQQLRRTGARPGELHFFQGDLYRLRGAPGDEDRALAAYRWALESGDAPPETHRNLGLLLLRSGDRAGAAAALARYLEARPAAEDRAMVQTYLDRLGRPE